MSLENIHYAQIWSERKVGKGLFTTLQMNILPRLLIYMLFYSCNSLPLVNRKISESNFFRVDGKRG